MNKIKEFLATVSSIGLVILFIIIAFTIKFTVISSIVFFLVVYIIYLSIVSRED